MLTPAALQFSTGENPHVIANEHNGRAILNSIRDLLRERVGARLGPGSPEFATSHVWPTTRGKVRLSSGPDWTTILQFAVPNQSWDVMFWTEPDHLGVEDTWNRTQKPVTSMDDLMSRVDWAVQKVLSVA